MKGLFKRESITWAMSALIQLLSAIILGCADDGNATDGQIRDIAFEIVILDEHQQEGTVFEPGTDVNIALKFINRSGKEFEWKYEYECQLVQTKNFLLVYGRNEGEIKDDYMLVGSPYQWPIYCLMLNVPSRNLPPGETMLIKAPWSRNPDNHPLAAGKYYVVANFALNVDRQSMTWNLKTDFEM
jgi:hypothetical protein